MRSRRLGSPLISAGVVAALVFFIASGGLAYRNLATLNADNDRLGHSHDVIVALDALLSTLQDAETGQRGFLLTAQDKYLAPYNAAKAVVAARVDEVAGLIRDNSKQTSAFARLRGRIENKMAELQETIDLRRTQGVEAALAVVESDRGKAAMDAIRAELGSMDREEAGLREARLAEMAAASRSALIGALATGALGVALALIVGLLLRRNALARQRQDWLQEGQLGLSAAMLGDQTAEALGQGVLRFLARYLGAQAGAIYVGAGESFRLAASYGVPASVQIPQEIGPRDGLIGQAISEARTLTVADAPAGYLVFGSALGQAKPRHIVMAPAKTEGHVYAVTELGFVRGIDEAALELMKLASEAIAIAVRSADYRSRLQLLLEETQRQAEEMQVQSEELRVSNEELEEQSRALRESQLRLEQQQVELEQTNAQLESQAQQLEAQRDNLERAHAGVEAKAREVEQASRYKSDFLANMSHELRTPLNSQLILAKLLADNPHGNLTEEQVKFARTIQSSGNDLLTLINDILDLSKIEAGRVEVRAETVAPSLIVKGLAPLFQPIAEQKRLDFDLVIAPDAPASLATDPQRLEQILKNLLANAFKFTEAGRVTLSVARAEGGIAFAVSDTGIGISEAHQQTIFESFRQADGTISRKYGGTGLGLSISREFARLLGGTLSLQSREGEGSTFTLTLPLVLDAPAPLPREAPPPPPPRRLPAPREIEDDREAPGSARVLLVIEDDANFASILRDLSREMGFRAIVAGTAEEALTLARRHMPSAIVLDIGLPDQSGLSVLDRLKRDVATRHIPIHVVSGADHAQTALALGAVGYMLKPVRREDLADVLRKLEAKFAQGLHRVLIVEDDAAQREAVARLLASHDVETIGVGTAAECLERLKAETFDCMVLDLSLPDASGYSLLETLSREEAYAFPPVIVYTGRDLSPDDEQRLRRYSRSIIIKGAKSPERLLDEVSLFLHQVVSELPAEHQRMIKLAQNRDDILEGRRILIVEDDVRNVYALTNVLEPRGAQIEIARNGREALDRLGKSEAEPIDLVLMDVMMPVMDGLTATREIRRGPQGRKLPIIALTAKAMPDDQQTCIDAGANDYIAKPLDVEKLLSLVRVWMPR